MRSFSPGVISMMAVLLLAGCAEDDATATASASRAGISASAAASLRVVDGDLGTLTIGTEACVLDPAGPILAHAGPVTITAVNATDAQAAFELDRIGEGGSLDAVAAFIAEAQRAVDAGEAPPGRPAYLASGTLVVEMLAPGDTRQATAAAEPGIYVIVCGRAFGSTDVVSIWPYAFVGPITVE